jgi:hypothetical protein
MRRVAALALLTYLAACSSDARDVAREGGAGASSAGSAGASAGAMNAAGAATSGAPGMSAGAAGSATAGTNAGGNSGAAGGNAGASGSGVSGAGGSAAITGTAKIMVLGSSNELITCWRALLWQKLQTAEIKNFDFVGSVTDGPDCGVSGYDKDLQAASGTIVSNLTAAQFAGWFQAHPPDIVLAHFGGADLLANMPVDGIIKGYTLAIQQARLVSPQVRFMIAKHTPQNSGGSVPELSAATEAWAAQNTTAASPITVVDLYTGLVTATDFSDGVHLNAAGSEKVASRWFAALQPLFKP